MDVWVASPFFALANHAATNHLSKCHQVLTCRESSRLDASKHFLFVREWIFGVLRSRWSLTTIQLSSYRKNVCDQMETNEPECALIKLYLTIQNQTKTGGSSDLDHGPIVCWLLLKMTSLGVTLPGPPHGTTPWHPHEVRCTARHHQKLGHSACSNQLCWVTPSSAPNQVCIPTSSVAVSPSLTSLPVPGILNFCQTPGCARILCCSSLKHSWVLSSCISDRMTAFC